MLTEILQESKDFFSVLKSTKSRRENRLEDSKLAKQVNTISQIFPKTGRISGPEVGDGANLDVPITDRQNEKNKKFSKIFKRRW